MFSAMTILSILYIGNDTMSIFLFVCTIICILIIWPNLNYSLTLKEEIPYSKLKVLFDFKEPKHIKRFINFLIDTKIVVGLNPLDKKQRELFFKFFEERYMLKGKKRLKRNMRESISEVKCDYSKFNNIIIPNIDKTKEGDQLPKSIIEIKEFVDLLDMFLKEENIATNFSKVDMVHAITLYHYCFHISDKFKVHLLKSEHLSTVLDSIKANTKPISTKKL